MLFLDLFCNNPLICLNKILRLEFDIEKGRKLGFGKWIRLTLINKTRHQNKFRFYFENL